LEGAGATLAAGEETAAGPAGDPPLVGIPHPLPPAIGSQGSVASPGAQSVMGGDVVSSLVVAYAPFGYGIQPLEAYLALLFKYCCVTVS